MFENELTKALFTNMPQELLEKWSEIIDIKAQELADYIDTCIMYEYLTGKEAEWGTPIEELKKAIENHNERRK